MHFKIWNKNICWMRCKCIKNTRKISRRILRKFVRSLIIDVLVCWSMVTQVNNSSLFKQKTINSFQIFSSVGQDVQISTVLTWINFQKLYILPNTKSFQIFSYLLSWMLHQQSAWFLVDLFREMWILFSVESTNLAWKIFFDWNLKKKKKWW